MRLLEPHDAHCVRSNIRCETQGGSVTAAGKLFEREGAFSLENHQARGTLSNSIVLPKGSLI